MYHEFYKAAELQWFADAYNLVFAAALLPAGMLGDRLGRKKMLIAGLLIFGVSPWHVHMLVLPGN